MKKQKISIVIPAHNEEADIEKLIEKLDMLRTRQKWDCEIVVVNDNSSDETPEIIDRVAKEKKNITSLHRTKGSNGLRITLKEGTKKAKGDVIIWTMGDNSDDINTYPRMIDKINQGFDIVIGSRYMKGGSRGDALLSKTILGNIYTFVIRMLTGLKARDITNAFRAFRKEVYTSVTLENGDFSISPELSIKAHLKGFKFGEVPTTYSNRKDGEASFSISKMGWKYARLLKYRFVKF